MENVTVEQAVSLMLEHAKPVDETEQVPVWQAQGRILAENMAAPIDNPPFARSPVDGYACRSEDIQGASRAHPVSLKVVEEIDAGGWTDREIAHGEAVRIMTGAAIPAGCDCCLYQEDTDYGDQTVQIYEAQRPWGNYCFAGEDFKKGTVLLEEGSKIGFVEQGILAGMGSSSAVVYRLPRIVLLTSGDEVVSPGEALSPGKIYNSNLALLCGRMQSLGCPPVHCESVPDDPSAMARKLREAVETFSADLVITTGAVSVGRKDIMHEALRLAGGQRVFWRVKMKPGMPTLFSELAGVPVLSLSGNPFGVVVSQEVLARPALSKIRRDPSLEIVRVSGVLADPFAKAVRGRRYVRARYDGVSRVFHLPEGLHSNGVLSSMRGCNCLLDLQGTGPLKAGDPAEAILL